MAVLLSRPSFPRAATHAAVQAKGSPGSSFAGPLATPLVETGAVGASGVGQLTRRMRSSDAGAIEPSAAT